MQYVEIEQSASYAMKHYCSWIIKTATAYKSLLVYFVLRKAIFLPKPDLQMWEPDPLATVVCHYPLFSDALLNK